MNADRFRALAASSAARWGRVLGVTVPVGLVLAIVQKESRGRTDAVRREPDGRVSRGLMQVLEGTARELGVTNPLELHVPWVGIDVGTHYLAKQLARYGGRIPHAVAAYNAGSARFTERETFVNQDYVDAVLRRFRGAAAPAVAIAAGLAIVVGGVLLARAGRRRRAA